MNVLFQLHISQWTLLPDSFWKYKIIIRTFSTCRLTARNDSEETLFLKQSIHNSSHRFLPYPGVIVEKKKMYTSPFILSWSTCPLLIALDLSIRQTPKENKICISVMIIFATYGTIIVLGLLESKVSCNCCTTFTMRLASSLMLKRIWVPCCKIAQHRDYIDKYNSP